MTSVDAAGNTTTQNDRLSRTQTIAARPGLGGRAYNRVVRTDLWTCHLGQVEYREALELQRRLRTARQAGTIPDLLLLLEHPPVYTRGRRSVPGELPMGESWYLSQGIDVVDVDRGGKVTYHGPGQLVGYPIMAVDDVVAFVRTMEEAMIAALADEGIVARSRADEGRDFTGVWVGERKTARSACTCRRAWPRTASRSTSRTTSSRSSGWSRAGSRACG